MNLIVRFPYDLKGCTFFTFFYEFEHLILLQKINLDIHIEHPTKPTNDFGNEDYQDIYKNNLKLFFHPSNPPCDNINQRLETAGFKRKTVLYDRWIYHYEKTIF